MFSIGAQRSVAKKRAAIDLILRSETIEFIEYQGVFDELIAKKELLTILSPRNGNDYEKRRKVRELLNHYELLAIAIETETIDEDFVKQYQRSTTIETWKNAEELIIEIRKRTENENAFIHFARLAEKWEKDHRIHKGKWKRLRKISREIFPK